MDHWQSRIIIFLAEVSFGLFQERKGEVCCSFCASGSLNVPSDWEADGGIPFCEDTACLEFILLPRQILLPSAT